MPNIKIQPNTCVDILRQLRSEPSILNALNERIKGTWVSISTEEFLQEVKYLALALKEIGLQKGDKVGILATASPAWTIINFAIMVAGGIVVPLFSTISDDNFIYEIKQTDIKLLFVGGEEHVKLMERHLALFNRVITIEDIPINSTSHLIIERLKSLILKGAEIEAKSPFAYEKMEAEIKPSDTAIIIYTSGSTGTPKGVELTQENIAGFFDNDPYSWDKNKDRYLSVLPLEHVFGYSVNLWMIFWGVPVYYSNDYKNLGEISTEVKPTAMVVVPRLLEKVYAKMLEGQQKLKGIKWQIASLAFKLAKDKDQTLTYTLLHPLLERLVYSKLKKALGGHLRVVISGGAALDPELHLFFERIGIPIYEGWGMTESCPICASLIGQNKVGSVGHPLKGYELKITPEGEILVRGKGVMRGYYKNPLATDLAIDKDKWLHTGDRGFIDENGILTILGRMKELYKTSTGEYVAPVPIEMALCRHPLIESALVIAEGKKFTSCLLFPSKEVLKKMREEQNAVGFTEESFLNTPKIKQEINHFIQKINAHLNHQEQIRAYRFITEPLTITGGDLTPSQKIKRVVVAEKYAHLIDEMYTMPPIEEKETL